MINFEIINESGKSKKHIQYFDNSIFCKKLSKNKYVDIHGYLVAMKQRLPMQKVIYAKQNVAK